VGATETCSINTSLQIREQWLWLPLILAIWTTASVASPKSTLVVQKIYIGSFGQGDDSERLRMLLANELTAAGLTPVTEASDAEATLTGILTVQNFGNRTEAHVTASLRDTSGQQIWTGDFGSSFHAGNDAVNWRAKDIAKSLKKRLSNNQ
jgi:hypothetical protein